MISIIVAVSDDWGIGKDNDLLYHIPEDLRRFKKLTLGKCVIMGKKTWLSLPVRPLPGRKNVVITDQPDECIDCSITAYSIKDAIEKCGNENEIFVIGGGSIYKQFMEYADKLYITHVHKSTPADVFFPKIDMSVWKITEREEFIAEDSEKIPYSYVIYERKNKKGTNK